MPPKMQQPAEPEESGPFNLLRPFILMGYSAYYLIPTVIHLLVSFQISVFFSIEKFKDVWFARFWEWFGPKSRDVAERYVMALLKDNARGVCLDIGPGSGQWLSLFSKANNPAITKIYGVEPNFGMHRSLQENAIQAGLGDVYQVVGCGAEELLTKGGFQKGSVDTIITVQCLCSIPTPEKVIRELYPLLKPGGEWLVFEHIKTRHQGDFVGYWQRAINIIWPHFFNGCDICRPTDEWLLRAGEWEEVKLRPCKGEGKYDTVPHVYGTLRKRA